MQKQQSCLAAAYEYARTHAPPINHNFQTGVAMVTRTLVGRGAERTLALTFREFSKRESRERIQLWLLSKTESRAGNPLFHLPLTGASESDLTILNKSTKIIKPFEWMPPEFSIRAQNIYDELLRSKPRLIYLNTDQSIIPGGIAAIMAGVPEIVLHTHSMSPPNAHGNIERSIGWDSAYRSLLTRSNVSFIGVAKSATNDYLKWINPVSISAKIFTINNGIEILTTDLNEIKTLRKNAREYLKISKHCHVIGAGFHFTEAKQPFLWLDTATKIKQRMDNTNFVLFGEGVLLDACKEYAKKKGMQNCTHFPGLVPNLSTLLPALDILMLSSRTEALPNILLEAQAAGVVPVAFDVGGCAEAMVHGQSGFLISPCTSFALAEQTIKLLQQYDTLRKMRSNALSFASETFSLRSMIDILSPIIFGNASDMQTL